MLFFEEEQRELARRRRLRIMDVGAGFSGGKETTSLLKQLLLESGD